MLSCFKNMSRVNLLMLGSLVTMLNIYWVTLRKCDPRGVIKLTLFKMLKSSLKGQSNEIFDLQLFSSFEPAWAADQCVKIFSIFYDFAELFEL